MAAEKWRVEHDIKVSKVEEDDRGKYLVGLILMFVLLAFLSQNC